MSYSNPSSERTTPICPNCGGPMQVWPTLSGNGYLAICPNCPAAPSKRMAPDKPAVSSGAPAQPPSSSENAGPPAAASTAAEPVSGDHPSQARPRDLLAQAAEAPTAGPWPDSLLEDLPDEARRLLAGEKPPPPKPTPEGMPEGLAQSLRDQGFVIAEDAHGVRLGGTANLRSKDTGGLKHHEVVRLAADLEGGIVPQEMRVRCPKCDAVMPKTATRCQWCGTPLPSAPGDNP